MDQKQAHMLLNNLYHYTNESETIIMLMNNNTAFIS